MIDFKELPSDGIKFEQLIRELLIKSGFEVHWTGVGPDLGRDLIFIERARGNLAGFERKWLVSCKHFAHSGSSVGLDDVQNIIDKCEAVGATGFLLACSTQPSSSIIKRFRELEVKCKLIIRYWDSIEIEKRLNTPEAFPLISMFFPESSKKNQWRIFNTDSPSFWAANYKDYFIYMSSRTANTFPELKDVEIMVEKIESIIKPEDHLIRMRAVYFDNKHDQYVVFVDYLYPHGEEKNIVDINEYIDDGEGLYCNDFSTWKITFWDIKYISYSEYSDHFHLDHKDYYKDYMNNFKTGISR